MINMHCREIYVCSKYIKYNEPEYNKIVFYFVLSYVLATEEVNENEHCDFLRFEVYIIWLIFHTWKWLLYKTFKDYAFAYVLTGVRYSLS